MFSIQVFVKLEHGREHRLCSPPLSPFPNALSPRFQPREVPVIKRLLLGVAFAANAGDV